MDLDGLEQISPSSRARRRIHLPYRPLIDQRGTRKCVAREQRSVQQGSMEGQGRARGIFTPTLTLRPSLIEEEKFFG